VPRRKAADAFALVGQVDSKTQTYLDQYTSRLAPANFKAANPGTADNMVQAELKAKQELDDKNARAEIATLMEEFKEQVHNAESGHCFCCVHA
jgi:hypothetical protein